MDHGQHEPAGRGRGEQAACRPVDVRERERERGRHEELPRRGRRQPERRVGAALRGRERGHRHLRADDRQRRANTAEEGVAGLVRDDDGEWREHRGLVQDNLRRVEEGDTRDERQEAMPERERVAGMQPTVGELVHGVERERVERLELAHAREMEEAVAPDLAGDPPEQNAQSDAEAQRPPAAGAEALGTGSAPNEGQRDDGGREQQHERQAKRPAHGERDRQRPEDHRQRPDERDRDAAQPERAGDDGAGEQQDPGREREPQQRHRSSSSGIRPDASQAATSLYIRPRSSR